MDALGHFAVTLANYLFWPMIAATVVGAIIGTISWIQRDGEYGPNYGSAEYGNATWRMWATAQGLAIMWIVYAVLSAVPTPDYKIKTVHDVQVVEKTVAADYYKAYSECRDVMGTETFEDGSKGEHEFCNLKALSFVNMKPETRVITKVKKVVEYKYPAREVRYRTLFNTCMGEDLIKGGWSISFTDEDQKLADMTGEQMRNERIKLCHSQIKEIVQ